MEENLNKFIKESHLSLNDPKQRTKYELMQEALYIANLFFIMNKTNWVSANDEYFILSLQWFEKWKVYTNFDYYINKNECILGIKNDNKAYFESAEELIISEVKKHFQNSYLCSNSQLYPSQINNYSLVYDGFLCHKLEENTDCYSNVNLKENLIEGQHYIIVSKDIWNYLNSIYGGLSIKRYKIDLSIEESIVEVKLKTVNITTIRQKSGRLEQPKLSFISRGKTIREYKKHLIKLFPFTQERDEILGSLKNYRLWVLDSSISMEKLEDYIAVEMEKNKNEYLENIPFPGILLDQFDSDYIGEIENLLTDNILIFEYKKPSAGYINPDNYFMFKTSSINYLENFTKLNIFQKFHSDEYSLNLYFTKTALCPVGFYEPYSKYNTIRKENKLENYSNANSLFLINEYFKLKSNQNINQLKKISNFKNLLIEKLTSEIKYYKDNLYLIYDKAEIINRFGMLFNQSELKNNSKLNHEHSNVDTLDCNDKLLTRYQLIMKKRAKSKSLNELKYSNNVIALEENNLTLNTNAIPTDIICLYCNRTPEDEVVKCEVCNKVYYCNDQCKAKDSKFHKRKCSPKNN